MPQTAASRLSSLPVWTGQRGKYESKSGNLLSPMDLLCVVPPNQAAFRPFSSVELTGSTKLIQCRMRFTGLLYDMSFTTSSFENPKARTRGISSLGLTHYETMQSAFGDRLIKAKHSDIGPSTLESMRAFLLVLILCVYHADKDCQGAA